jgi:hypothetical protein
MSVWKAGNFVCGRSGSPGQGGCCVTVGARSWPVVAWVTGTRMARSITYGPVRRGSSDGMPGGVVSKFGIVEFGGRYLWTYDVSLSIMLAEAIWVGEELPADQRPEWLSDALDQFRVCAVVSDFAFVIDRIWLADRVGLLRSLLVEVGRRLAARGRLTVDEVATWNVLDGDTIDLRGAEVVDMAEVVELTQATIELIDGTLPEPPPGTLWMYGFPGGRSTVPRRG